MAAGIALAILAVVVAVFGVEGGEGETSGRLASADEISRRPSAFVNRRVIVGGETERVVHRHALVLGGRFSRGRRLLVVTRAPIAAPFGPPRPAPVLRGDLVQIAGEVRTVDVRKEDQGLGTELDVDLRAFDRMPAVVAESVVVTPRAATPRGGP